MAASRNADVHGAPLREVMSRNVVIPAIVLVDSMPFIAVILTGAAMVAGLKLIILATA